MGSRGIVHTKLRSLSRQSLTRYDVYIQTLGPARVAGAGNERRRRRGAEVFDQDLRGEAKELQSRVGGLKSEIKRYIAALK